MVVADTPILIMVGMLMLVDLLHVERLIHKALTIMVVMAMEMLMEVAILTVEINLHLKIMVAIL